MSGIGWGRRFLCHSRPELVCPCVLEPGGSGGAVHTQTLAQALGVTKACGWTQGLDIGRDCREMKCLRGLKLSVGVGLEEAWRHGAGGGLEGEVVRGGLFQKN